MNDFIKGKLAVFGKKALSTSETVLNSFLLAENCIQNKIEGAFVECGVFCGTQIAAMALANQFYKENRKIHLFDSFIGIPQAGPNDDESITSCIGKGDGKGALITTGISASCVEAVKGHMKGWGIDSNQLVYHKGWFQETLISAKVGSIAVLRLDGDLYESTKVCLRYLHPLVSKGGYVIIDDWNLTGCKKACQEYWAYMRMEPKLQIVEGGGGPVFYKKEESEI